MCFIDLKKAFDRIWHDALFEKMASWGIPKKLINVVRSLYTDSKSFIQWDNLLSDFMSSDMGVKQGCVLSPLLFALFIANLPHILKRNCIGARLGDVFVPCLFFADDLVLLSNSKHDFQLLLKLTFNYF